MSNFTPEQIANIIPRQMNGGWKYNNDSEIVFNMRPKDVIESVKQGWLKTDPEILREDFLEDLPEKLDEYECLYNFDFKVRIDGNGVVIWRLARHIDYGVLWPSTPIQTDVPYLSELINMFESSVNNGW